MTPRTPQQPPPTFERMYTLRVAAEMIPFVHAGALRDWLYRHRHEFPSRTIPMGRIKRPRMLYMSEIQRIRAMRMKEQPLKEKAPGVLRREKNYPVK